MIEVLILVVLGMVMGGLIVQREGMKGLAIGVVGILFLLILWFIIYR